MTLAAPRRSRFSDSLYLSLQMIFSHPSFVILGISLTFNLLLAYVLIFLRDTTFRVFFNSTSVFYIVVSIGLTVLVAVLGGLALTQTIYILANGYGQRRGQGGVRGVFGAILGALSASCPACASTLLPLLGIAGSLAVFPLGGLEIKLLALIILTDTLWEGSRVIAGVCPPLSHQLINTEDESFVFYFDRTSLRLVKPAIYMALAILMVYLLPKVPAQYRLRLATAAARPVSAEVANVEDVSVVLEEINPAAGYTIPYTYGDIGPRLISVGAIDLDRFTQVYVDAGYPLTEDQLQIMTQGSADSITLTRDNAHFLLNLFWALGLANQNPILDEGPLTQYGEGRIDTFASTGGWTLAAKPVTDVYSSVSILPLTPEQQGRVDEAAENTYRPCCNNSTAFADCNHGMAMLGLFELMASQGASVDELFDAAKYFNAYWFPQQTLDLAAYFKATSGQNFAEMDARTMVSMGYASGQGWSAVRQWLAEHDLGEELQGGGGCGV